METEKDRELWRIAKKRVDFKRHAGTYVIINALFWALWYLTGKDRSGIPWPVWPMLGWGIGLLFSYKEAYVTPGENSIQKEYDKLKNSRPKE